MTDGNLNLLVSPNNGQILLLALGVGAIVGAMLGGWFMNMIHKLMLGAVKLVLLGAVVVVGVFLWNQYQQTHTTAPRYLPETLQAERYPSSFRPKPQRQPTSETDKRWWEK